MRDDSRLGRLLQGAIRDGIRGIGARCCPIRAVKERTQALGLAIAAVHLSRVYRQREPRRRVPHLRHHERRSLPARIQEGGERPPQAMRRQALRQRSHVSQRELTVRPLDCLREDTAAHVRRRLFVAGARPEHEGVRRAVRSRCRVGSQLVP